MEHIITSLAPVFFLIFFGAACKRYQLPGDSFWPMAEKMTYYIFLPSLFFYSIAKASFAELAIGSLIQLLALASLVITVLLYLIKRIVPMDGPSFSSVFQGGIRFNNYVGIPAVLALFGNEALTLVAVMIAILIPIINSLCLFVLYRHGSHETPKWWLVGWRIITNPLIVASVLGVVANMLGVTLPIVATRILDGFVQTALVIGLMSVGAGLDIKATKGLRHLIVISLLIKLLLFPLVVWALSLLGGLATEQVVIIAFYMGMPAATSSYIMARQLGGNAPLMAGIMVAETLCSMVTLPAILMIAQALQLL